MKHKSETLAQAGLKLVESSELNGTILVEDNDGKREVWALSNGFAGYTLLYNDDQYEFVSSY